MRMRPGLALAVVASVTALAGACAEQRDIEGTPPAPGRNDPSGPTASPMPGSTASWEGKEDQEEAMQRATRALNAVEPDGASRVDEGMENLTQGLAKTFEVKGTAPYTFGIACQAPTDRTVTLTLSRGTANSEWEVTCGDREADRFDIPAGGRFTAGIAPTAQNADGLVLWRLDTVAADDVDGCDDDIQGCEN
ncbi:hypothetical protein JS756_12260 [Streptomyces actuosus]|uniref:Lipoprotein n=1 Tax=Streptomyces actuosus TaxID=1885 RepID=A0ABS2VP52_STRAS|nr:hypothetical protein [Streptomyces actuosus]MBN0044866.1 hypothetical protein [Streptomyces actuosus]